MPPVFSIIVACCDVEPYLRDALDSVLGQSFQNWECLLCVEDSRDRTLNIANEYAAADERFRVFTQKRSGSCSAPRNTGIDNAQGEYVIFLDGDDTIENESLARIAKKINARPGADIYPCAIVMYEAGRDQCEIRDNYASDSPAEMNGVEATVELKRLWGGAFCPMLQLSVFRREFLIEHNLKCIIGLRRQDNEFSPRALYLAKRVVPLHEQFYLYRIRENSVSTSARGPGYFYKDWAIITKSLLAFFAEVSREPDFDPRVAECWVRQWISRLMIFWFLPGNMHNIPRKLRHETLQMIFADGFDDFNALLKYAGFLRRFAGWWVCAFVRYPLLQLPAEFFFRCCFLLWKMKKPKKQYFRTADLSATRAEGQS